MESVLDRRIRRTRRALTKALIDLTSERPFNSITVRDITDRADIGYATFYRHFDSKDDLMLVVFNEVTTEFEATAGKQGESYFDQEGHLLFTHVQKYQGLYRSILQSQEFMHKLRNMLARHIGDHIQRHSSDLNNLAFPIELAAHHMATSLVGLIEWWLEENMQMTVEKMAYIYKRLIIDATLFALPARNILASPAHKE